MLLTALYFSPPWAARAALARSIGVVVAVIAVAGDGSVAPPATALLFDAVWALVTTKKLSAITSALSVKKMFS